jgi:GDP-L-fucose synthase
MVGSRLTEFLLEQGAVVSIMDNFSRGKTQVPGVYAIRRADATSEYACRAAALGKDVVFNLAAKVGGIYYNVGHNAEQFWENMKLLSVPAIGCAQMRVPVYVQVSTVCVYNDDLNDPALEENGQLGEPEGANAGYAWAKRMGERVCAWAFEGSDTRWMVARPSNMFGPRDYFDDKAHVIPALLKKFLKGDSPIKVFGGSQAREFLYTDDAARGLMVMAEKGQRGEVYNLGTGGQTRVTIADLAELIRYITYKGSNAWPEIEFDATRETGDKGRSTDISKIRALGWEPQVGLKEGLERVLEWYLSQPESS